MNDKSSGFETRRIAMLVYEHCDIIDACAPLDAFAFANLALKMLEITDAKAYSVSILGEHVGLVRTFSGVPIFVERSIGEEDGQIDTLLIAGGPYFEMSQKNPELTGWISAMSDQVRRIGSICTGAFLLAESGVLEGHRATTHWGFCQRLKDEFPRLVVEANRIFMKDGGVYTSGGVTAGIDLALYMIEEDWGHEVATTTARAMVTFPTRPGGQAQYSRFLLGDKKASQDFRMLQEWINANPLKDLSVEALAERMCMSPRNFSRRFDQEVGMTPAKFVESSRLSHAFFLLENTLLPIGQVARQCGFQSAENMRRSFQRNLCISPQDYRARFRSPSREFQSMN